ncbi:MAG TPA: hypothetical protein VMS96_12685 [Terriglobales bacterium]|nr:hypothetical protein [Terriglobales bacterium]
MDLAPNREPRGDVSTRDNPQQEPPIEPNEHETSPLSSASPNLTVLEKPAGGASGRAPHPLPLWLRRIMLFIFVAFAVEIGMFLVVMPWYDGGRLWSENGLLLRFPTLRAFLIQDFVRGVVSGIGLIDIWVGIWEAVHYKESIHK